ncbi:MAG: InlB B-repeat-containing protein, partial [Bacillus sp. (in: Bacteria)]|nr:InlB B-repeat-containing protein [Bacillus sp. (in: firmicutes)]
TKNGYIDVKRKSAETKIADAIISPQASSGSNTTVNLTYPIGCTNGKYTCTYTKDSEAPVSVGETTTSVNFIGSGTIATEVKSNRNSANKLTNSQNITIEYTASFLKGSNVSSVGKSSEACTVTSGNTTCEVTLPSITANTGHLSVGWSTTNGATTGTAAGQKVSISKNTTYYANAKVNTYTIAYTLNSGTHGSSHPTSATFNTAFTLNNPTRSGYTFSGWSISGMDSTTHYFGNTTSTATSSSGRKETSYKNLRASAGTVTFAAAWTQNKVTITSSKDRNTTDGYKSCRGNWYENRYNYTINYNGSSIQSGKMCYSDSNGGSTAKGCRNYSDGTGSAGGYGDACFNSATSWKYHRSNYCTYAYAKATNGASASKYQC